MKKRPNGAQLGKTLIALHLKGYRPVPGYTVTVREPDGSIYIAMQLEK